MRDLTTPPETLRILVEQLRAIQVRVADDGDSSPDMRKGELQAEIEALTRTQQHELVALLWTGRGDADAGDWDETLALAEERHVGPTFDYLMSHPMAADHIASGLEDIGHDHVLLDGEY
ncbi:MAG: DUF3775 domain-containing protein [Pseudomonadota bacterium]